MTLKKIASISLTLLLLNGSILPVYADTSLWRVSKHNQHIFLGGTVHLMSTADYPLPALYDQAYKAADILVLETDLNAAQQPEFQERLMAIMQYPEGVTLEQTLDADVYAELKNYLALHHIPMERLQRFKPGMVALTVTVVEMQRLGMAGTGVDAYFNLKAQYDAKPRLYLETPEQQVTFIAGMARGRENELIRYTLQDLNKLPELLQPMKAAWRSGDRKTLETIALTPWKKDFPYTYKNLLVKRNKAWYPQLIKMLKTEPVELVLVGALHLVGTDGLLQRLERNGYTVTPVSATNAFNP